MSEVKRCENCGNEQIQILNYKGDYLCGICGRDTERLHEIEHDAEIRAKAIDEFVAMLEFSLMNNYRHLLKIDMDEFEWLTTDSVLTHIRKVKEQLKGGAVDG